MRKLLAGVLLGLCLTSPVSGRDLIFKNPTYNFELLRVLGAAPGGGSDIEEALSTAFRIEDGSDESWYREWTKTAGIVEERARKSAAAGHKVSASEAYERAATYYRTAEFFLHTNPSDPRILESWRHSQACFRSFAEAAGRIRTVQIPFEGTTLPGYFCTVDGTRRPTLLIQTGFDGAAEELYCVVAVYALKRGYNCLIFEGPGQGAALREQHLLFRPNWETVVTPVVDFAVRQPEVDASRVALEGRSMGGYLAPRAAAFEPRIKACIANGGVFNFGEGLQAHFPDKFKALLHSTDPGIDATLRKIMVDSVSLRWLIQDGMWKMGTQSPSQFFRMTEQYSLTDCVEKIRCKMLVVQSEADDGLPGQEKKLYDALRCPKELMLFTTAEGAGHHCQEGATTVSAERILDWLDENL